MGDGKEDVQDAEKAEIHACHGTEQTRASRAYDRAGAHLRLEDKHRHLYKLVDTLGKKKKVRGINIILIKMDDRDGGDGEWTEEGDEEEASGTCTQKRRRRRRPR